MKKIMIIIATILSTALIVGAVSALVVFINFKTDNSKDVFYDYYGISVDFDYKEIDSQKDFTDRLDFSYMNKIEIKNSDYVDFIEAVNSAGYEKSDEFRDLDNENINSYNIDLNDNYEIFYDFTKSAKFGKFFTMADRYIYVVKENSHTTVYLVCDV